MLLKVSQIVGPPTFLWDWQKFAFCQSYVWQKIWGIRELCVTVMFVNGLWRNEQSLQRTFHRCFLPSFGSFVKVVSEEKIFLNQPIRNKNCLWRPSLLMDRDEMSILYRGPSIDASYQVSVHLAEGFQRRRLKCEKLTDDRCQVMAKAHIAFGKVS